MRIQIILGAAGCILYFGVMFSFYELNHGVMCKISLENTEIACKKLKFFTKYLKFFRKKLNFLTKNLTFLEKMFTFFVKYARKCGFFCFFKANSFEIRGISFGM